MNIDDKWSSQVWKSGFYDKFVIDDDMDSDTVPESNFFSLITIIRSQGE